MQLGIVTNAHVSLAKEIEWAVAQGLTLVDVTLEAPAAAPEVVKWETVRALLADHQLKVVCRAATYLPLENPAPFVRQAAMDELKRALDATAAVGATLCTVRFGGWPGYLDEGNGYDYYRQLFTILINHARPQGVQVALENSPRNEHQLKYFREIFHRLPELKLAYHMGHGNVNTMQSMTREYLFALADRLAHVRLCDNDGRSNLYLPLGAPPTGGLKWQRDLQILRSFRYDGTLALQIDGERRWVAGSLDFVREAWQAADPTAP